MRVSGLKGSEEINESGDDNSAKAVWDPLDQRASSLSASASHLCRKSRSCNEEWGLLGCVELYKLKTAEERRAFCKEHNSCNRCGTLTQPGDFSALPNGAKGICHKYDWSNGKMIAQCTGDRCWFSAATCEDHE